MSCICCCGRGRRKKHGEVPLAEPLLVDPSRTRQMPISAPSPTTGASPLVSSRMQLEISAPSPTAATSRLQISAPSPVGSAAVTSPAQRQSPISQPAAAPPPSSPTRVVNSEMDRKRHYTVSEIIDTERRYNLGLRTLLSHYVQPLHENGLVSEEKGEALFGEVRIIKERSDVLLRGLEAAVANAKRMLGEAPGEADDFILAEVCVGNVFVRNLPCLRNYSRPMNPGQDAIATLSRDKEEVSAFLATVRRRLEEENTGADMSLSALLITPVQRLGRYKLLIEELLRYAGDSMAAMEENDLKKALREINEVTTYCNDIKSRERSVKKVREVVKRCQLSPSLDDGKREFVMEGDLEKEKQRGKGSAPCHLVLFSDLLVCCKFRHRLTPARTISMELKDVTRVAGVDDDELKFVVEGQERSRDYTLTVLCEDENEKDSWVSAIDLTRRRPPTRRSTLTV